MLQSSKQMYGQPQRMTKRKVDRVQRSSRSFRIITKFFKLEIAVIKSLTIINIVSEKTDYKLFRNDFTRNEC